MPVLTGTSVKFYWERTIILIEILKNNLNSRHQKLFITMKMRRLPLLSACIFFFFSLQSCYNSSPIGQTVQDITYVIEEQVHYSNNHYLPLLDALARFEDFRIRVYEENKENREKLESKSEWIKELYKKYDADNVALIENIKKHVMDLLNGKETINDYLRYMLTQRNIILFEDMYEEASLLLSPQPRKKSIFVPSSKKLSDFFIEDSLFQKGSSRIKKIRLNSITFNELMDQLIQIPLGLTEMKELNHASKRLLLLYQPNAIGGPYALLEDIIFADDLIGEKKKACLALRDLLGFDKLRKLYPSNFYFVKALFRGICNHTNSAITLHFLQVIEGHNIKLFYGLNEPEDLSFFYDVTEKGLKIIVPSSIKLAIKKLLAKQEKASLTSGDWLAYIEGASDKKKQTYSSSKQYKNKRDNLSASRGKGPKRPPAAKNIKGDKLSKIDFEEEKKPSNFSKQEKEEKLTTKQPEKSIANNPLDRSALLDEKNEPTISFTPAEGEKNTVPQMPVDTAGGLNVATINDDAKAASIPSDQIIVVNTNPIKTKIEELTTLPSSVTIDSRVDNRHASQIISFKENELLLGKAPAEYVHIDLSPRGSKQKKKKKSVPLTIVAPIAEPTPTQKKETDSTVGTDLNKRFVMPRGLRTFHAAMIQKAYSPIADPKHQDIIDQLFDLRQQCNTTYHQFKVLWSANGGFIIDNRGSHRTLQFPINVNLFGIYKPHGSSAGYGKNTVGYLQAAVLYIGLRPTGW